MNDLLRPQIDMEFQSIDPAIRENKIGLVRVFIEQAKEGRMDRDEVIERIDQLRGNNFITDEDVTTLTRQLDESLGITPEQIRENKIGLVRVFIEQAKEGRMDRDEVIERIDQLRGNNFITDEDVTTLTRQLDEVLV